MRLDRLALKRDLAGDVALRILIVLTLDVDARPDKLDRADGVGRIIDGDPIDIFERRQHLGAQLGVEHRPAGPLVDEAVGSHGHDQHVAELAGGFEMAHVAEMEEVERAVGLHDCLTRATVLFGCRRNLGAKS